MANDPLVQIQIRGASVAIIAGEVYAIPFPPPNATTWIVKSHMGRFRFIDQASGFILCARDGEPGAQAFVQPPGFAAAVTQWRVLRYSDAADADSVPVENPSELDTGFYALKAPDTGRYLYRNQIEDLSVRPKVVALQSSDLDQGPLILKVSR
jgi:hypothetical protein